MGNQMTTTTLSSTADNDGNQYWVSIDWKSFCKGGKKKCYFGKLNGLGPRHSEKVVVKVLMDQREDMQTWIQEVRKAKTTQTLSKLFNAHAQRFAEIHINVPLVALMDTVSKMNDILGTRSRSRSLSEDDWVSIEKYIPGQFKRFCACRPEVTCERSDIIEAFCHFTFHQSRGQLVVCDLQGVTDGNQFDLTDPIIHSRNGTFGQSDEGLVGINEFFKFHRCNNICGQWPRMLPLSPPPSFEDIFTPFISSCPQLVEPSAPPYEMVSAN